MEEGIDIHDFDRRLERAERKLKKRNPISARNSEILSEFERYCAALGMSKARIAKYMISLRIVAERLGKDFDRASRRDIERVVRSFESNPNLSPWTKQSYRAIIKRFYRWLKGNDEEYPPEVKWIKTTLPRRERMLPRDLLTEEEIQQLVEAAGNPRDRAFIMTLYETGGRIGEVGALRIRDVRFQEGYASVMLKGKTGARRVPVVAAVPYLQLWLEHHPAKSDPKAPLWVKLGSRQPMSYPALAKVLKTAAERAGLEKRVSPHVLRHSRATFLATKLTEAQMSAFFGWRQGSEMPSTYVHLSGREIDETMLGIYGLKKEAEEKPSKLAPKTCVRCKERNPSTARFCFKCGMALSLEAAVEAEEHRRHADELMSKLLKDPEVRRFIKRKLSQLLS